MNKASRYKKLLVNRSTLYSSISMSPEKRSQLISSRNFLKRYNSNRQTRAQTPQTEKAILPSYQKQEYQYLNRFSFELKDPNEIGTLFSNQDVIFQSGENLTKYFKNNDKRNWSLSKNFESQVNRSISCLRKQQSELSNLKEIPKPTKHVKQKAFFKGIREGNIQAIEKLVYTYPELIKTKDSTLQTCLHWASKRNQLELVQLFLSQRADPNSQDIAGRTPLQLAQRKGNYKIAKLLQEKLFIEQQSARQSKLQQYKKLIVFPNYKRATIFRARVKAANC